MPDSKLLECCRNRLGPEVRHLRVMDTANALCGTGDQDGCGAGSFSHLLKWPNCRKCPALAEEMGPHPLQADDAPFDLGLDDVQVDRGELDRRMSLALDPTALEVGRERNLAYDGPRGARGFPLCTEPGCGREATGPFSFGCFRHAG